MGILEVVKAEIERLKAKFKEGNYYLDNSEQAVGYVLALDDILSFINTLEETSYDTQKYTPRPSVSIEDVARVQFASHAKVIEKKRKAIFDWEQFKEVAGIFYGFGKKDSSDTLEEPDRPEPYSGEYDEAYLNEKIKKATEHWKGVDVDKMLAECRGYDEESVCEELDGEINRYINDERSKPTHEYGWNVDDIWKCARHFAKWGAEHLKR